MFLCKEDCHNLYEGVCKNDFKVVTDEEHGFLPDCKTLPSSTQSKCIKLGVPGMYSVSSLLFYVCPTFLVVAAVVVIAVVVAVVAFSC